MTLPLLLAVGQATGGTSLISLLLWLLIFAIIVWLAFFILGHLPIGEPWRTVITAIIAIILLVVLLGQLGLL